MMDLRFKNNTIFQIVGPSGCGKTLFTVQLLSSNCFRNKIKNIYWLMGTKDGERGLTSKSMKHLKNVTYLDGFEEGWMDKPKQNDVIVVDDLFNEAIKEKNFTNLFTKIAKHRFVTVVFITQNMFHQGGQHRTRNLNVHYLVLFKNPRDSTVVEYLARQAFPGDKQFLVDAFKDATQKIPYGYLLLDFTQDCPEEIRVRTDSFNSKVITIYKECI